MKNIKNIIILAAFISLCGAMSASAAQFCLPGKAPCTAYYNICMTPTQCSMFGGGGGGGDGGACNPGYMKCPSINNQCRPVGACPNPTTCEPTYTTNTVVCNVNGTQQKKYLNCPNGQLGSAPQLISTTPCQCNPGYTLQQGQCVKPPPPPTSCNDGFIGPNCDVHPVKCTTSGGTVKEEQGLVWCQCPAGETLVNYGCEPKPVACDPGFHKTLNNECEQDKCIVSVSGAPSARAGYLDITIRFYNNVTYPPTKRIIPQYYKAAFCEQVKSQMCDDYPTGCKL